MIDSSSNERVKVGGGGQNAFGRHAQLLVDAECDAESTIADERHEGLFRVGIERLVLSVHLEGALQAVIVPQLLIQAMRRHAFNRYRASSSIALLFILTAHAFFLTIAHIFRNFSSYAQQQLMTISTVNLPGDGY